MEVQAFLNKYSIKMKMILVFLAGIALTVAVNATLAGIQPPSPYNSQICAYADVDLNYSDTTLLKNASFDLLSSLLTPASNNSLTNLYYNLFLGRKQITDSWNNFTGSPTLAKDLLLYFSHIIIPIALAILIAIPLLLLCMCQKYVPCCYRHDRYLNRWDHKCCPSLNLAFSLMCLALAIFIIVISPNTIITAARTSCSYSTLTNSVTAGQVDPSNNQSFFAGLNPISKKLTWAAGNISTLQSNSSLIINLINNVNVSFNSFVTAQNSYYASQSNIIYPIAFYDSSGVARPVTSGLRQLYIGPKENNQTVLGIPFAFLSKMHSVFVTSITKVKQGLSYLISIPLANKTNTLNSVATQLLNLSNTTNGILNQPNSYTTKYYYQGLKYGLIGMGLALIIAQLCNILANIFTTYFNAKCFLYLFKAACFVNFILLFPIGFTAAAFSAVAPASYIVCSYMPANNLTTNYTTLFSQVSNSKLLNNVLTGNNLFTSSYFNSTIVPLIQALNKTITFAQNFRDVYPDLMKNGAVMSDLQGQMEKVLNDVFFNLKLDVKNNVIAMNHLRNLAAKTFSTANCNSIITQDAWVPNVLGLQIPCPSIYQAKVQNCANLRSVGCSTGCFGFTNTLGTSSNPCTSANNPTNCTLNTSVAANTTQRYGSSCLYATYLNSLNSNYDNPRHIKVNSIRNALKDLSNLNSVYSTMNRYKNSVDAVLAQLTLLLNYINGPAAQALSSSIGLLTGANTLIPAGNYLRLQSQFCSNFTYFIILNTFFLSTGPILILLNIVTASFALNKYSRVSSEVELANKTQLEQSKREMRPSKDDRKEDQQNQGKQMSNWILSQESKVRMRRVNRLQITKQQELE